MIFLAGLFGITQALYLPGDLVVRLLGLRGGLRGLTAAMALSLLFNFFVVSLLVALRVYTTWSVVALIVVEFLLGAWLWTKRPPPAAPTSFAPRRITLAEAIAFVAVAALAIWYAGRVLRAASGIFSGEDDVASWNRWALDWTRGRFPQHTWHYPQIVPVAWSITYRLTGHEEVQAFARAMMPLFGLGVMAALAIVRAPGRVAAFAMAWFAGTFLARVNNVTAGLADLPVAFFTAMALAECLRDDEDRAGEGPRARHLGWLFCAGAALAKQAGLYVAIVVPLLLAWRRPPDQRMRALLLDWARIAAVVLPWYAIKQLQIATGTETSEVAHVLTGAHQGVAVLDRPFAAVARLAAVLGGWPPLLALAALAAYGAVVEARVRPIVLAFALPYTVIWVLGYSYDPRNLSVALVAWAIGCGAGAGRVLQRMRGPEFDLAAYLPRVPAAWGRRAESLLVAAPFVAAMLFFPDHRILAHTERLQRGLGDPVINHELFGMRARDRLGGHIAADPGYLLAYAPGWDSLFVTGPHAEPVAFMAQAARPDVRWVVIRRDAPRGLARLMEVWEKEGAWRLRERSERYDLWERRALPK